MAGKTREKPLSVVDVYFDLDPDAEDNAPERRVGRSDLMRATDRRPEEDRISYIEFRKDVETKFGVTLDEMPVYYPDGEDVFVYTYEISGLDLGNMRKACVVLNEIADAFDQWHRREWASTKSAS